MKNSSQTNLIAQKLQQTENYLKNLLLILPEQIYWMDTEGRILNCNKQQAEVFGLSSAEELIGKNIYDVAKILGWKKAIPDNIRKNDLLVMENKKPLVTEEIVMLNGENRIFMVHKNPLLDEHNNAVGIIGISIDITDKKRIEALQKEKEIAERMANFANMVAGTVAHELRTPLTNIGLQMDLLENTFDVTKVQQSAAEKESFCKQTIKTVKTVITSASYVINDLLAKLRSFAAGKVTQDKLDILSITSDIEDFLTFYPFETNEKELIKLKNFENLSCRFKYAGDKTLTQHMLSNLLKNSLRAIKEVDKGEIIMELKTSADSKFNQLIFKDTASGIPDDFVAQIFDQYATKKSTTGGTGLGLSFCKMVMESYGGSIACTSKEGEYTEFVLSFPKVGKHPKANGKGKKS